MITKHEIEHAIEELGMTNENVCIHSSLKSFNDRLEQGCDTILEGFLEKNCTVLVPSFTYDYIVRPPADMRPVQNGCDYESLCVEIPETAAIFTCGTDDITVEEMGAFPAHVVKREGRIRGDHPLNSFTAIGPKAKELIMGQSPEHVYAPFEEMYKRGGKVLLMGVNLCEATVIHYAEQLAGRRLFVRWAMGKDGEIIPVRVGSCSNGFGNLGPSLASMVRTTQVGTSRWQCFDFVEMVDICADAIKNRPEITHCLDENCERCKDAVLGGPIEQEQQ